jgi:hypothetical protein
MDINMDMNMDIDTDKSTDKDSDTDTYGHGHGHINSLCTWSPGMDWTCSTYTKKYGTD